MDIGTLYLLWTGVILVGGVTVCLLLFWLIIEWPTVTAWAKKFAFCLAMRVRGHRWSYCRALWTLRCMEVATRKAGYSMGDYVIVDDKAVAAAGGTPLRSPFPVADHASIGGVRDVFKR